MILLPKRNGKDSIARLVATYHRSEAVLIYSSKDITHSIAVAMGATTYGVAEVHSHLHRPTCFFVEVILMIEIEDMIPPMNSLVCSQRAK